MRWWLLLLFPLERAARIYESELQAADNLWCRTKMSDKNQPCSFFFLSVIFDPFSWFFWHITSWSTKRLKRSYTVYWWSNGMDGSWILSIKIQWRISPSWREEYFSSTSWYSAIMILKRLVISRENSPYFPSHLCYSGNIFVFGQSIQKFIQSLVFQTK